MPVLNEYQAASLVGMSPTLLRWLTKYAPKQGEKRKLASAQDEQGNPCFDRASLLAFNDWLMQPWPQKDGKRPPIPTGIREEIKVEANGECAMCKSNAGSCEAAHLDPVANSKNNHPHNLIWLCANHHTKYDKGSYGPLNEDREFIGSYKTVLHRYNKLQWDTQANLSQRLYGIVSICVELEKQLNSAQTKAQVSAVRKIAAQAIHAVSKTPVSKADKTFAAFEKMTNELQGITTAATKKKKKPNTKKQLNAVTMFKEELRLAAGLVSCPLCCGTGYYNDYDCPECEASGSVAMDREIDLHPYKKTKCPLCKGRKTRNGLDCPACRGDGELENRFLERVDVREFDEVKCPLCEGKGQHGWGECPECGGDGTLERRHADRIDLRSYNEVDCPLCEGTGFHGGDSCPACHGDRRIERRYADRIDVSEYQLVTCRLCSGSRAHNGNDCPVCAGDGRIERRFAERVDLTEYKLVKCRKCNGRGESDDYPCRACSGDGKVEQRFQYDE